jgi:hypothetical protein
MLENKEVWWVCSNRGERRGGPLMDPSVWEDVPYEGGELLTTALMTGHLIKVENKHL